jgi:Flp pilus assembly protein TadG
MITSNNNNRGQVLVFVAISLIVLLGFAALAIDFGYFYHTKNQLQGAADAAALAGASLLSCVADAGGGLSIEANARQEAWMYACKNKAAGSNVYLVTGGATDCNTPPSAANLNGANVDNNDMDIVVGNWSGSAFQAATGSTGLRINAIRVKARRSGAIPIMPKVGTFFGKIFGIDGVSVAAQATASGCYDLSPIAANEYWMGDQGGMGGGGGNCGDPSYSNPVRSPYRINHVYPNSFVKPPVGSFPTLDCQVITVTPAMISNGPLSSPCSGAAECQGRPPGKPSAGRVFAIVGAAAQPNGGGGNMYGLANLDDRIGSSNTSGGSQQWYHVSGTVYTAESKPSTNPLKDVVASYLLSGKYLNDLPVAVTEVYQPGYITTTLYTSVQPYASVSFFDGSGVTGNMVMDNFYVSGNYSNGKYAPGKKIIAAVYDGIVGGSGTDTRVTIVGFTRFTVFGYGNNITLNSSGFPSISGPENTLYGYVENISDFSTSLSTLLSPGPASLVQ